MVNRRDEQGVAPLLSAVSLVAVKAAAAATPAPAPASTPAAAQSKAHSEAQSEAESETKIEVQAEAAAGEGAAGVEFSGGTTGEVATTSAAPVGPGPPALSSAALPAEGASTISGGTEADGGSSVVTAESVVGSVVLEMVSLLFQVISASTKLFCRVSSLQLVASRLISKENNNIPRRNSSCCLFSMHCASLPAGSRPSNDRRPGERAPALGRLSRSAQGRERAAGRRYQSRDRQLRRRDSSPLGLAHRQLRGPPRISLNCSRGALFDLCVLVVLWWVVGKGGDDPDGCGVERQDAQRRLPGPS